jgi:hypothetical protein
MLNALLEWKATCAFARCSEESQLKLRELSKQWGQAPRRKGSGEAAQFNGWGAWWIRVNEPAPGSNAGPRVPIVWAVFESHMTSSGKVQRGESQSVCYKDQMFQSLAVARNPTALLWSYGHKAFHSALREIVNKETWSSFGKKEVRDEHGGAVIHADPDDSGANQAQTLATPGGWLWEPPLDDAPDIAARLTDDFLEYAYGELSDRQKVMCFYVSIGVGFSVIPLDDPAVQRAAGTRRFQALYEEAEPFSERLITLAKSRLKTDAMGDADVDPYDAMLLVRMLLRALIPKIKEWAEAENFPQPPFSRGNKSTDNLIP